jgi:hypothetical protein
MLFIDNVLMVSQRDKRFYKPAGVQGWIMVIFERPGRFNEQTAATVAGYIFEACRAVGTSCFVI